MIGSDTRTTPYMGKCKEALHPDSNIPGMY